MLSLRGALSLVIQWEPHHKCIHLAGGAQRSQVLQVLIKTTASDGLQRTNSDAKRVTPSKTNAFSPHIEAEDGTWFWCTHDRQRLPSTGVGSGGCWG